MPVPGLKIAALVTTVAYAPISDIDDHRLGFSIVACDEILDLRHLYWTPPEALNKRMEERGCQRYWSMNLQLKSTTSLQIEDTTFTVMILFDPRTGKELYELRKPLE